MSTHATEQAMADSPLADPDVRERLRELPPSAKLVARILATEAGLAQGELAERSLLPTRTVRYALNRLEEAALVVARPSLKDARKQVYALQP